jgi:transposase InsO family protein
MEALREHGIVPGMSRPANPYDYASCESFTGLTGCRLEPICSILAFPDGVFRRKSLSET